MKINAIYVAALLPLISAAPVPGPTDLHSNITPKRSASAGVQETDGPDLYAAGNILPQRSVSAGIQENDGPDLYDAGRVITERSASASVLSVKKRDDLYVTTVDGVPTNISGKREDLYGAAGDGGATLIPKREDLYDSGYIVLPPVSNAVRNAVHKRETEGSAYYFASNGEGGDIYKREDLYADGEGNGIYKH